jgi:hypothetical protein
LRVAAADSAAPSAEFALARAARLNYLFRRRRASARALPNASVANPQAAVSVGPSVQPQPDDELDTTPEPPPLLPLDPLPAASLPLEAPELLLPTPELPPDPSVGLPLDPLSLRPPLLLLEPLLLPVASPRATSARASLRKPSSEEPVSPLPS